MIDRRRIATALLLLLGLLVTLPPTVLASVEISDFRATNRPSSIRLNWETGFEDNNLGFHLWRATENDVEATTRITTSLIPSQSQGGSGASYVYDDTQIPGPGTYYYWVEDIDGDSVPGDREDFFGPVSATFGSGSGLSTPTPRPTSDGGGGGGGQPTATPTATVTPTPTGTVAPGASPTATSAVTSTAEPTSSSRATATVPVAGTATPAGRSTPAGSGGAADESGGAASSADTNQEEAGESTTPAAAAEIAAVSAGDTGESSGEAASGGDSAAAVGNTASARNNLPEGDEIGDGAATIGGDTDSTTAEQLGTEGEDDSSPVALMLLAAGLVLTLGGGITAFVLLRRA